ncbi:MAG: hypothetical protein IC227_07010 [Enterococcus lacertideformus]|uniref:Uncharacterized protein n=1 Tax=Enterococcus lacertideformus TaxID=2771493 RepID=A0A931AWG5_9ENTE|nr:hypothetical protein [Enterococcus lacertideformus]
MKELKIGTQIAIYFSSDRIMATKSMPPQISDYQVTKILKLKDKEKQ